MNPALSLSDLALLVKDAIDAALLALPKGYECTVDGRLALDTPWAITVTVVKWPVGVEILSRDALAAERRRVLLGLPSPLVCSLPLSGKARDLLQHLTDVSVGVSRKYAGVNDDSPSVACEAMFDERQLKEERKQIMQSLKTVKIQMSSLYGKFGPVPDKRSQT